VIKFYAKSVLACVQRAFDMTFDLLSFGMPSFDILSFAILLFDLLQ